MAHLSGTDRPQLLLLPEAHRNIETIWLLRHLKPDFRTIAAFRRVNRSAFRTVFREFVILCRQLDLFGGVVLAGDGTRIKAVNNKDRNFTRAALSKFIREADYMKRLDEGDAEEERVSGGSGGKLAEKIAAIRDKCARHKAMLEELDRTGEDQISLTDPDARAMARMTKVGIGYNVQLAVDVKHKLIAEQEVVNQRYFAKELFHYDPDKDVYVCPGGATLSPRHEGKVRDNRKIEYCDRAACKTCALKPRCTGNLYRRFSRLENEAVLDRMAAKLDARPDILDRLRKSVEHPFGTIKKWMNQARS
ncbi:transposase [Aquamicrobium defluvii]|uniref:transposase n=1 Tax=Aquamicrobium defluvii TaxID=69279 RepID=UPI0004B65FFF|nr:transposase [Aquamicrobium defluvii]